MLAKVLQLSMWVTPTLWKLGGASAGETSEARTGSRNTELTSCPLHLQTGQMGISQRKCQGSTCDPPKESLGGQTCSSLFRGRTGIRHQPRLTAPQTLPSASPMNSPQQGSTEEIHWQFKFSCLQLGDTISDLHTQTCSPPPQFQQIHGPVFQANLAGTPWLFSHHASHLAANLPTKFNCFTAFFIICSQTTLTPHLDNSHQLPIGSFCIATLVLWAPTQHQSG